MKLIDGKYVKVNILFASLMFINLLSSKFLVYIEFDGILDKILSINIIDEEDILNSLFSGFLNILFKNK